MASRIQALTYALLATAAWVASPAAGAADIASGFDSSAEGWLVSEINALPGSGSPATWDSATQRITTSDIASWTTYSAPPAFLGNLSAFHGGSFSFQLTDNLKDDNADSVATFGIASGATALYWFGGAPSTTAMTSFAAGLGVADTRWRIGGLPTDSTTGTAPTASQFQAVLAAVTAIRINADWRTAGNDITALDNVLLSTTPVPEPASGALLALGLVAVAAAAARTRRR